MSPPTQNRDRAVSCSGWRRLGFVVRVEREEPALPVELLVDGVWREAMVEGWVLERGREPRAQVTWSEPRDYGYVGQRVDVVDRDRLRPRNSETHHDPDALG